MKALIWKEWRALGTRAMLALIMTIVLVTTLAVRHAGDEDLRASLIIGVWTIALPLLSAGLGCFMLARERSRGELSFSSSWPASKGQVWVAKLILGLLVLAAGYALTTALSELVGGQILREYISRSTWLNMPMLWLHAAACFMLFGLGFMASGVRPGPFDAIMVSLLTLLLLGVGLGFLFGDLVPRLWGPQLGVYLLSDATFPCAVSCISAVILGVICIVASAFGALGAPALAFGKKHWRTVSVALPMGAVALPALLVGVRVLGEPQPDEIKAIYGAQCSSDGRWIYLYDATVLDQEDDRLTISGDAALRLWLMRSDGSDLRCIARWPVTQATWSPDGRWIGITWGPGYSSSVYDDRGQWCWIWDLERMRLMKVPRRAKGPGSWGDVWPRFLPGGQYLYVNPNFVRLGRRLEIADAELPQRASGLVGCSSDGGSYYFRAALKQGEKEALWAADLPSGGNLRRIAVAPMQGISSTEVSPDGKWIAWSGRRKPGFSYGDIVLENLVDGRKVRLEHLSSMYEPWSPGMAYFWASGEGGLSVVNLAEGRVVRTFTAAELRGNPHGFGFSWSPDGKRRVFQALSAAEPGEEKQVRLANLWVVNADGSGLRSVAEWSGVYAYFDRKPGGWTEDGKVVMVEHQRRIVAIDPETRERKVIFEAPSQKGEAR